MDENMHLATKSLPLTVYKASAGSGKTFTLATEYIKLLVAQPNAFRSTLAVTFTNKATEEMKMRILSQLYGIWQGLPSSKGYADVVCRQLNASPQLVAQRAGIALRNLLHNYSYFRVETIDSFFQSVLRNLARELDLTANLRVELNDTQVEEMAVDQLIESLSTTDVMLQWLLGYIMDNISEDRSWNVIGQIKRFGRNIFQDFYKKQSKNLNRVLEQPDFFDRYIATMRDIRSQAKERMRAVADSFFAELDAEGLTTEDLSYGKNGVAGMFLKMREGVFDESIVGKRVTECLDDAAKWCKKTHPARDLIMQMANGTLGDILRYAVDEQPRQWRLFKSADLTLRHMSQLRLLNSIEQKVRQLNEDENRFLLSDTQSLLNDLMDGSDSPFVFEKIGTQLEHIMIDEFQDTSTVQWQNFKVLLGETMSHAATSNLIVGDVKQSIYRWRSGDWRLLATIDHQFPGSEGIVETRHLDTNYRSCRKVIEFNNAFFTLAAAAENAAAYDDVVQKIPADRPDDGQVTITLLPPSDYQDATLHAVAARIEELLDAGAAQTDIAILVRSNSHIQLIANHFTENMPEVSLVSDEAFRLDASTAVTTIVQAMRFLCHPDDKIAKAHVTKAWSGSLDGDPPVALTHEAERLLSMPLYDLAEHIAHIFGLWQGHDENAYLCTFFDCVASFVSENTADVFDFLHEWDENIGRKTIQCPEMDGIRIISIHKSKGLEFEHVIVPFCDWKLEHSDILWCSPAEEPFNLLPLVPVDYSEKGMKGTIYQPFYDDEHQQVVTDNLNLLYVAFTRAVRSLFVVGRRKASATRSALIEAVVPTLPDQLGGSVLTGQDDAANPLVFSLGTLSIDRREQSSGAEAEQANVFTQRSAPLKLALESFEATAEFRQSKKSQQFATADDDGGAPGSRPDYVQLGSVLHEVFSSIDTTDDVEDALKQMEQEGIIYDRDITPDRLKDLIRKRMADPRVARWFASGWQVFNECTILLPDGQQRRPDRVITDGNETIVIDFKFGTERSEYRSQVTEYVDLLTQMGYPSVRGYLWYVYSNKITEVCNN